MTTPFIVVATGLYSPDVGGPATYSVFLERQLPTHGIRPVVVPFGRVRHLPKLVRHVAYAFILARASRGARIIYALDPVSVGVPARIVAVLMRKTFLIRIAGDYAWEQAVARYGVRQTLDEFLAEPHAPFPISLLAWVERRITRAAAHVVVPSRYLKGVVERWGVPASSITVVYNVFEMPAVSPAPHQSREQHTRPVILSAGRLVPWKGFIPLIQVMNGVQSAVPGAMLLIAGDGPDRAAIEAVIAEENLTGSVHLLGALATEALYERIAAADLFVLNTGYEGFSHQLLEVMAIGTPVVTTAVGGNPELIEDGKEGLVVPWGDRQELRNAIVTMLTEPERRTAYVAAARAKSASFTVERALRDLTDVLKRYI